METSKPEVEFREGEMFTIFLLQKKVRRKTIAIVSIV